MTQFIYGRTSTTKQNVDQQAKVMMEAYPLAEVRTEKASGKDMERPVLQSLLSEMVEGDSLIVYDLSRLGRNAIGVCTLAEELKQRGITLVIKTLGIDTSTPTGTMVLTTLAAVAQMEREMMLEKQAIGIERAKAEGKFKGKQQSEKTIAACEKAVRLMNENGLGKVDAAKAAGVSRATLYRYLNDVNQKRA
ncbi:recombinase family protein [Vibrio ouci]|uniref:Recombinase family protein n=1 Tax=Vibrio ouci TaxID=2499078 RepID=A0A4Y8WEF9_9VIBR|nr:recombinase family protein [Vibrio ouci]TFH91144.1 recombinase family protein [Vibrio ouci]